MSEKIPDDITSMVAAWTAGWEHERLAAIRITIARAIAAERGRCLIVVADIPVPDGCLEYAERVEAAIRDTDA